MTNEKRLEELSLKLSYAKNVLRKILINCTVSHETQQDSQTVLNSDRLTPKFGFIVYPDGEIVSKIIIDDMIDIQASVEGYFELIKETEKWLVFANEDGLSQSLKKNLIASLLAANKDSALLVGPVLFLFKE